ncbi:MAG: hypothetical protein HS111_12465 [Kofleriaceae bacterium]|nr:hypothetical protein [Kofleriaceae bacterium]
MRLGRQTVALEALGVDRARDHAGAGVTTVALAYLVVAAVHARCALGGGMLACRSLGMADPWPLLTAELVDPRPARAAYPRARSSWWRMYAWGIADATSSPVASAPKPDAAPSPAARPRAWCRARCGWSRSSW